MRTGLLRRSCRMILVYTIGCTITVCTAQAVLAADRAPPRAWPAAANPTAEAALAQGIKAYEDGDYATASASLVPLADAGHAVAQFYVGSMHAEGDGMDQSYVQAAQWFRRAAVQGYAPAQVNLGSAYGSGLGVARDETRALAWFQRAARQGNALAQYNIGVAYARGDGVPRSARSAVHWFRQSAANGNPLAQNNLGVAYATGRGVSRDVVLAYALFSTAAAHDPLDQAIVANRDHASDLLSTAERRAATELVELMLAPGGSNVADAIGARSTRGERSRTVATAARSGAMTPAVPVLVRQASEANARLVPGKSVSMP